MKTKLEAYYTPLKFFKDNNVSNTTMMNDSENPRLIQDDINRNAVKLTVNYKDYRKTLSVPKN